MSRSEEGEIGVGGVTKEQSVTYDAVGHITAITTDGSTLATPVEEDGTNRLRNATYDAGGNVIVINLGGDGYEYDYDALNVMKHLRSSSGEARVFLYDAADERIVILVVRKGTPMKDELLEYARTNGIKILPAT